MEENRATLELSLSETFAKINDNFGIFRTNNGHDDDEKKPRTTTQEDECRNTVIKKKSFELNNNNNESSRTKPLPKARSLSSHFVVNFDEIVNCVAGSFDDQSPFGNKPHNNNNVEERGKLLSFYESSSSPPRSASDPVRLRNSRSDASAAIDEDEDEEEDDPCGWRKVQILEPSFEISLKFEDVNYNLRMKGAKVEKHIVQGVSGAVFPGEVLALMGPSGGGKTTLLNLLSGRLKCDAGLITYNNHLYTKSLKRRIGFVLQDDTVFPHLTVKETLTYSALLRLPESLSSQQKMERAMDVLSQLGLDRCQNTMVGGKFVRGVSGGEKKRVCIGNEILLNPSLLFLDEPTSGLDSTTALRIIQMLQGFAKAGKTVVITIHQPSSRLFSRFDKLILLSNGSSLYFGKASDAMKYFSSIGYFPLILMNPAEFLIDLASGNVRDKSVPSELKDKILPSDVHKYLLGAYETRASRMEKIKVDEFMMFDHKQSTSYAGDFGASWSSQFCILFKRGLKERRHEYLSSLRIVQVVSTAIITGLIWWNSNAPSTNMDQDQEGLLFFISVYWAFFPVFTAIFTFPLERAMLAKERSVEMYKLSAYLLARNTSDLPLDLSLPIIFLIIIYFMVGLKHSFSAFSLTLLSIFLSIIAAQGLGQTIGAAFMDVKKATTLASVTVMTFMLSGGFFINKVPPFMRWIRYLSLNYHTYKLLMKVHYNKFVEDGHGGIEVGAMVLMSVGYRLLTYILLRRMKLAIQSGA